MRVVPLLCAMAMLLPTLAGAQTSITLTFIGARGEPIAITRAQLLVTAWGVSERIDLPANGSAVELDLDATRPTTPDSYAGYVYITAKGYAPLVSEPFPWPRANLPQTAIDFRDGRRSAVAVGRRHALTVRLRPAGTRQIRLVDTEGRAVAATRVESAVYWDSPNHCGFFAGTDTLGSGLTDGSGRLAVPDVDGWHAFILDARRMEFIDAPGTVRTPRPDVGVAAKLTATDTTLTVRRFPRRQLVVDIVRNGKPVSRASLLVDMGLGVCGAGGGVLGTSDAKGRILVNEFYPDEWINHWICEDKKQIWVRPNGNGALPSRIDIGVTPSAAPNSFGCP